MSQATGAQGAASLVATRSVVTEPPLPPPAPGAQSLAAPNTIVIEPPRLRPAPEAASVPVPPSVVSRSALPLAPAARLARNSLSGLLRIAKFAAGQLLNPMPLRVRMASRMIERFRLGSYAARLEYDLVPRPYYGFCVYHAARLAALLGHRRISVIEFGVAGGNGLVNLEAHAEEIERETGIACDLYGFDTGSGLPPPTDLRDLPYIWKAGFYECDVDALRQRLKRAELILGDVAETVRDFAGRGAPAIGAAMVDLDLFSSTAAALKLFLDPAVPCLPRILLYFDDVTGPPIQAYNEFTGELLAIEEFNRASPHRKIAPLRVARRRRFPAEWNDRIYVLHLFDHPDYATYVGPADDQRPLRD